MAKNTFERLVARDKFDPAKYTEDLQGWLMETAKSGQKAQQDGASMETLYRIRTRAVFIKNEKSVMEGGEDQEPTEQFPPEVGGGGTKKAPAPAPKKQAPKAPAPAPTKQPAKAPAPKDEDLAA